MSHKMLTDDCPSCGRPNTQGNCQSQPVVINSPNSQLVTPMWVGLVLIALIGGFIMGWLAH